MVLTTFKTWNISTYVKSTKNKVLSCRGKNENIIKKEDIIQAKINDFSFFKALMLFLLICIIQLCRNNTCNEVKNNEGCAKPLEVYRSLAESETGLDAIFDLYKENFLRKMGCSDEDSEKIKTTLKSHLRKTADLDKDEEEHRKKMEECEDIIKLGSNNSISKFLNRFRELSSPYFLTVSSFILLANGYHKIFLTLVGILIFKMVNFFWDLKYVISKMTKSM
ncbi:Plasmodium exported protein, unknown function [Plasmodium gonderi]|uniref:Uncharacterized protein n=1 Tax=Plasmodium gonderi TaxID=77519 RepID=A0A1Y1JD35_PLAGO|nr:Plasmodium exported protein, unknown function [Plasmodium gonderi]GAW80441.1 Plasmodium exported protein, unknown function [Plasmodium gonderi]